MEKRTRTVQHITTEEIVEYVSKDGRYFKSKEECQHHEKVLLSKLMEIEQCHANHGKSPLDGGEYMECHDYTWYRPKTAEEIETLNAYYKLGSNGTFNTDDIGEWVCVEETYDDAWCMCLSTSMDHIKEFFAEFGYNVEFTEKKEGE